MTVEIVDVPTMTPVLPFIDTPLGNPDALHVYGATPPKILTGTDVATPKALVPRIGAVIVGGVMLSRTAKVNRLATVACPTASVTFAKNTALVVAVAVPDITPALLSVIPVGSDPAVMVQVYGVAGKSEDTESVVEYA